MIVLTADRGQEYLEFEKSFEQASQYHCSTLLTLLYLWHIHVFISVFS